MSRCCLSFFILLNLSLCATGQVRVVPKTAKGGEPQGKPWASVPEAYRNIKLPDWPLPTDRDRWERAGRTQVRRTLLKCLGEIPPRPDPGRVRVVSRDDKGAYWLERIEFDNGTGSIVPGLLLVPKNLMGRAPAIVGLHGHGSSKESVCTDLNNSQCIGPLLAERGFVVAAIDAYFNGDRIGHGPGGANEHKNTQEHTLFKLFLWQGRTLWGMMLRDEQCLIDYLATRPEIDPQRIGATGMSMGCTRSWWLSAIDDRVQAIAGVACFTRYTELIAHGNLRSHGIYYFVPDVLRHFDTEAIYSLTAPRPMLMLSGDQDSGAPTDGIEMLERKLADVYKLYGKSDHFRSVVYANTGHEYLPEMKDEVVRWFEHLKSNGAKP